MSNDERVRNNRLKSRYGISLQEYLTLKVKQNYSCAICLRHESTFQKQLAVDHDHKTGKVRGLLCRYCNQYLLTNLNEDAERALRAYKYLIGDL